MWTLNLFKNTEFPTPNTEISKSRRNVRCHTSQAMSSVEEVCGGNGLSQGQHKMQCRQPPSGRTAQRVGKRGWTPGWVEKTAQTFRADEILKILSAQRFFSAAAALSEFLFPGPRERSRHHMLRRDVMIKSGILARLRRRKVSMIGNFLSTW